MGPVWVQWVFSVACLAVGGYFATELIIRRGVSRGGLRGVTGAEYELSHLGMALGMAAMFAPVGDPVPRLMWMVVFGLSAAWFASRALHTGLRADSAGLHDAFGHHDAIGHHLVANVAMLFMLVSPHHQHGAGAPGGQGGSAHDGHVSAAGGGWLDGPLGTVLTVALAGYFAVHVVRSLRLLVAARSPRSSSPHAEPTGGPGVVAVATGRRSRAQPRVEAGCHGVMDVTMTAMFGLMLWP